jgi:hypothetical protein
MDLQVNIGPRMIGGHKTETVGLPGSPISRDRHGVIILMKAIHNKRCILIESQECRHPETEIQLSQPRPETSMSRELSYQVSQGMGQACPGSSSINRIPGNLDWNPSSG